MDLYNHTLLENKLEAKIRKDLIIACFIRDDFRLSTNAIKLSRLLYRIVKYLYKKCLLLI
jgi:hypothetical protein